MIGGCVLHGAPSFTSKGVTVAPSTAREILRFELLISEHAGEAVHTRGSPLHVPFSWHVLVALPEENSKIIDLHSCVHVFPRNGLPVHSPELVTELRESADASRSSSHVGIATHTRGSPLQVPSPWHVLVLSPDPISYSFDLHACVHVFPRNGLPVHTPELVTALRESAVASRSSSHVGIAVHTSGSPLQVPSP